MNVKADTPKTSKPIEVVDAASAKKFAQSQPLRKGTLEVSVTTDGMCFYNPKAAKWWTKQTKSKYFTVKL